MHINLIQKTTQSLKKNNSMAIYRRIIFLSICLLVPLTAFAANGIKSNSYVYVVNLMAMTTPINPKKFTKRSEYKNGTLFVSKMRVKGRSLNVLRVGAYSSQLVARKVSRAVKKYFTGAYVSKLSKTEAIKNGLFIKLPTKKVKKSKSFRSSKIKKPSKKSVKNLSFKGSFYAVNLMAMAGNINLGNYKQRREYAEGKLFITKKIIRNKAMNILRVGPYRSKEQAIQVALSVDKYFKGAFITKVRKGSSLPLKRLRKAKRNKTLAKSVAKQSSNSSSVSKKGQGSLIERARLALVRNEVRKAIGLFKVILQQEGNDDFQEAQELLGLSYERNGQIEEAKKEYDLYLYLFPEGESSNRVRQRLQVLLTANDDLPMTLSEAAGNKSKRNSGDWKVYGGVNQYYRVLSENDSDLYSFASFTGRKRTEKWNIRSQFTVSKISPIDGNKDPTLRLSDLYIDINKPGENLALKLGRQRSNKGGVFTRFDGAAITPYSFYDNTLNLIMGAPVENSKYDFIDKHKRFYGVNIDSTLFEDSLSINTYYVQQTVDGVIDRDAFGVQSNYYSENINLFSVLDYDLSYQDLNIFMLNGSWNFSKDLTIFFNIHHRKSPFLLTTNALQGQTVGTIEDLGASLNNDELFQLADDNTSTINLINIGFLNIWDKDSRIRGTMTITNTEGTKGSANVLAIPATSGDYSVSFQLIEDDYLGKNDTSILQLQYSKTSVSKTFKTKISSQIPFGNHWKVEPKSQVTIIENIASANNNILSMGLKAEYKYSKDVSFDIEFSGDVFNDSIAFENESIGNIYFAMGYQWYL